MKKKIRPLKCQEEKMTILPAMSPVENKIV